MVRNQPMRYAGPISLIGLLVGFVIFVIFAHSYYDSNIVQRDKISAAATANYAQLIERIGPYDEQLRSDILRHLIIIRDGAELVSEQGVSLYAPPASDDRILTIIAKANSAISLNNYAAFQKNYIEFSRISARIDAEHLKQFEEVTLLAVAVAALGVLGILGLLFHRLTKADAQELQAHRETYLILTTVNDGLFFIDEDFEISQHKSRATKAIFGERASVSGNFFSFLEDFVSVEDLKLVKEFVELLYNPQAKKKLLSDLNPTQEFAIHINNEDDSVVTKYISIALSQDEVDDENRRMLVMIKDITNEISLKEALDSIKEAQNDRAILLKEVLQAKMSDLNKFFVQSESGLNVINNLLAEESSDHTVNLHKLDSIYKASHQLMSDANNLGLEFFEVSILSFEESVQNAKTLEHIDGQSLSALVAEYGALQSDIELVRSLTSQKSSFTVEKNSYNSQDYDASSTSVAERLNILAQRVANREGKEIELDCTGFHLLDNDPELQETLFDITIQLVRNSIVHGIESAEDRVQLGKKTYGTISILLSRRDDDKLQLIVRDDGRGLQFANIKQKAIEERMLSEAASLVIEPKKLLKFIFKPGFSSADHLSVDAGSGVGLDVVKAKVNNFSGKIGVRTSRKKYCQFKIQIPYLAD